MKSKGPKVLVIEDSEQDAELITAQLKKINAQVTTRPDGQSGITQLGKEDYNVVMLNLSLPGGISGLEVLLACRRIKPHVPIFIITGFDDERTRSQVYDAGAVVLLRKPYTSLDNQTLVNLVSVHNAIHDRIRPMRNPLTTIAGIVSIVVSVGAIMDAYMDGDPKTMPAWAQHAPSIATGIGLIFALDARRMRQHEKECLHQDDNNNKP
jgi:CheY-like chemotaxis protein